MDAFDLMINRGLSFWLLNLDFFPKKAEFQIEMLFVTNFSGNPIWSVHIWFFSFSVTLSNPVEKGMCTQFTI